MLMEPRREDRGLGVLLPLPLPLPPPPLPLAVTPPPPLLLAAASCSTSSVRRDARTSWCAPRALVEDDDDEAVVEVVVVAVTAAALEEEEAVVDECRDETACAALATSASCAASKLRAVGSVGASDDAVSSAGAVVAATPWPTMAASANVSLCAA